MRQLNDLKKKNDVDEDFILKNSHALLKEARIKTNPVDLHILASFCDIRRIIEENIKEVGMLIPLLEGGAEIYLRKQDSRKRKRFTCCHEIAHTFLPDYQLKPQKRIDRDTGEYRKDNWEEYLCDLGASELLMPSFLFEPKFFKLGFSIHSLICLSNEFEASLEATAIKMIRRDSQKTAVIIWEEKYKPIEKFIEHSFSLPGLEKYRPQKKLRVKFGYGFENLGHIPKDKSLEETERIIQKSFIENKNQSGFEEINFGNFSIKCELQTLPLEYGDKKRVLSLLRIK